MGAFEVVYAFEVRDERGVVVSEKNKWRWQRRVLSTISFKFKIPFIILYSKFLAIVRLCAWLSQLYWEEKKIHLCHLGRAVARSASMDSNLSAVLIFPICSLDVGAYSPLFSTIWVKKETSVLFIGYWDKEKFAKRVLQ